MCVLLLINMLAQSTSLDSFVDFIQNLDFSDLKLFQSAIENVISHKLRSSGHNSSVDVAVDEHVLADAMDYVDFEDQFINSCERELLSAEIDHLNFDRKSRAPNFLLQNKFISNFNEPYVWSSRNGPVVNNPLHMNNHPVIRGLMDKINLKYGYNLNSVVVSYYKNGSAKIGYHDDGEDTIDSSQPICVLSLGATRRVEFCRKGVDARSSPAHIVDPPDSSLYTMKAGCQERFMHRVRMNKSIKGERVSLSFRCFTPRPNVKPDQGTPPTLSSSPCVTLSASDSSVFKTPNSSCPPSQVSPIHSKANEPSVPAPEVQVGGSDNTVAGFVPWDRDSTLYTKSSGQNGSKIASSNERLCLLFSTSITRDVMGERMSRGSRTVINISYSGANLKDVTEEVESFHKDNPRSSNNVDKIIFLVGTNEIKWFNCRKYNVSKCFRAPLINLIKTTKALFPQAQLIFHCVLPIRVVYNHTARSVLLFNMLLLDVCREHGCIFFDSCFKEFLGYTYDPFMGCYFLNYNTSLYRDNFHLNGDGLKILCRALKFAVYRNLFNPLPY